MDCSNLVGDWLCGCLDPLLEVEAVEGNFSLQSGH